jgi:hypothetical protein
LATPRCDYRAPRCVLSQGSRRSQIRLTDGESMPVHSRGGGGGKITGADRARV